jgi:serine/threonine protein kinase
MIHLHTLDIVHFDLKASNIYISDDSKMVIGDFGQAKFITDGIIFERVDLYPALAPVEAAAKKAYDKTTDIYQFGLLLYSMVCYDKYRAAIENTYKISNNHLKQIFRDKPENVAELKAEFKENIKKFNNDIKSSTFPDRNEYPYFVPNEIKDIIHKCLEPIVENRYNNFYQIQADLNKFIFPKHVCSFYQHFENNKIHFLKDEVPCEITIIPNGIKFDIETKKNGRKNSANSVLGISRTKLSAKLFKFAANL